MIDTHIVGNFVIMFVTLEGAGTVQDTTTIDVYDNSCTAAEAIAEPTPYDAADFNQDCLIDINDLTIMALTWLENYAK